MAFLRDCVVVVLITGYFNVPTEVQSVCDSYIVLTGMYVSAGTFEKGMIRKDILTEDLVRKITDMVRDEETTRMRTLLSHE